MKPIKEIWHDPVGSKVIAAIIISVLAVAFTTIIGAWPAVWAAIKGTFTWLGETSPIYNWLWLLGAAITLTVIVLIIIEFINSRTSPASISHTDYNHEIIEGIRWRWRYVANELTSLNAFCAKCDFQIQAKVDYSYSMPYRVQYLCEDCGHSVRIEGAKDEIESRIVRKIHKRLRNGTWRDVVEQQLAEQTGS